MGGQAETIGMAEARGALSWWLEAGVDVAVQEQPRDWLKPTPRAAAAAPAPVANVAEPNHNTLAELQQWLASSAELPLASATARRILPHGPENAAIMLLSDAPALEDFAAGQPIGGDAWTLAGRMLAAIGMDANAAYSASLSCFYTPGARMADTDREACALSDGRFINWRGWKVATARTPSILWAWPRASTRRLPSRARQGPSPSSSSRRGLTRLMWRRAISAQARRSSSLIREPGAWKQDKDAL